MPARLGPTRFFPGSSVSQIPQVFRNSRAPSSSARAYTKTDQRKSESQRVYRRRMRRAAHLTFRPDWHTTIPHGQKRTLVHKELTELRSQPAFKAKFEAVLCKSD